MIACILNPILFANLFVGDYICCNSGSSAAALQPHWCLQNGGICTLHPNTHFNGISTIYKTAGVARQQTVDVTDMLYETDVAGAQRQ